METKKINSQKEALSAFVMEFGSLIEAFGVEKVNYHFQKAIIIKDGKEIPAYIAHNEEKIDTLVVPIDGSTPTIENFADISIVRKVASSKQAMEAFVYEFASLMRLLNPASSCFDGYVFEKKKITVDGETFKAYIASDTSQKTMFIVPVNGDKPDIKDCDLVAIQE